MKLLRHFLIAIQFVLVSFGALAATYYVDVNGTNPTPPYSTWATAATNIQDSVNAADPGDQVMVTNGIYQFGSSVSSDGTTNRVFVSKSLTIQSVNGASVTTINGGQSMRCIYLTNGATLAGFTLSSGTAGNGGGVYCTSTNVLLLNCSLSGNTASMGGGAYSGTLSNCTLSGNVCPATGNQGGGAYGSTLNYCTLTGNKTGSYLQSGSTGGGGAGNGILNNCTLSGNYAYGAGANGGAAQSCILNNCRLDNNYADYGGGGASYSTLNNCLIANNTTDYGGGGAMESTLNNCVVSGNYAGFGSGISFSTANNSILYNQSTDNGTLNYCCTLEAGTVGCFTNNPLFSDGSFHLQPYSPCVNAGNNSYVATSNDFNGNPRIVGGTVDCGAYENQTATTLSGLPSVPTNLTALLQHGNAGLSWPGSYKASGYNIYRAITGTGPFTNILSNDPLTNYSDNGIANGTAFIYYVTAVNAYGESLPSPQAAIYAVDHLVFGTVPSPQTAGVPFPATVKACDSNGNTLSNFSSTLGLSASGDHGNVPLAPADITFTNGNWSGSVILSSNYPDTNIRLTVSSNNVSSSSNPFNSVASAIEIFIQTAADLAYNPLSKMIYASVPATGGTYSNSILVIDPNLGQIVTSYYVGNNPDKLAVSDDGQSLYIGFDGAYSFGRFNLTSRTLDFMASLGTDSYYNNPYYANQFAVFPGQSHSVAVAVNNIAGGLSSAVFIFDDGVERSNIYSSLGGNSGSVAAPSNTRIYTGAPFTRMNLDQTGIASYDVPSGLSGFTTPVKYDSGMLFCNGGMVFNPENLAVMGILTNTSITEPDMAAGRIFSMGSVPVMNQFDAWTLHVWNSTNLQLVGDLPIPGLYGGPLSLIRWGTNGIAFCTSSWYRNQIVLVRSSLVPGVVPSLTGGRYNVAGTFQLNFTGDRHEPYSVLGSTDLQSWTQLGTPSLMSNGNFWFFDATATNYSRRFYKIGVSQ